MTISGAATATGGRRTKQDLSKKKQPLLQSEETDRSASFPNDTGDKDMEFAIQLQIMGLFAVLPN